MSHGPRRPLAPWSRRASSVLPAWTLRASPPLVLSNTRSIPCSMAGGMGRRDARASLHERIHGAPSRDPAAALLKHCWVTDRHGRLPGLLLEWRRTASGWQGRVVRPVLEEGR